MKFSELVKCFESDWLQDCSLNHNPDRNPDLVGVAAVEAAPMGTVSYIEGEKFAKFVQTTAASALILPPDTALQQQADDRALAWLSTPNPRLLFAAAIAQFYQPYQLAPQIHPTAVIDPTVELGQDVAIGAHVVIERGVKIGDRVCIFPNVVIYPECEIGAGTVLHANCTIEERSILGQNCVIHSGAVIGGEGFGFVPTEQGWYKMHQSGRVMLGDGVEIGCNSTVDRPSVGETRIGNGTKIDNLVQIAHQCQVGNHVVMSSQVGLSGQVTVGDFAILAGQVGVANQVKIGSGAIATAQSGLHKDVPPKGIVSGTPAIDNKLWRRVAAATNRLPEMWQTLRQFKKAQEESRS